MDSIRGMKAGFGERCRAIMLSERMWSIVREWKTVSSRIVWVRLQFGNEKWVIVSAYGPESEETGR
jgi:hypothetical protein